MNVLSFAEKKDCTMKKELKYLAAQNEQHVSVLVDGNDIISFPLTRFPASLESGFHMIFNLIESERQDIRGISIEGVALLGQDNYAEKFFARDIRVQLPEEEFYLSLDTVTKLCRDHGISYARYY